MITSKIICCTVKALIVSLALIALEETVASLENILPRYFVVGYPIQVPENPLSMESYVVPINDQEQIDFARGILREENPPWIVVSTVVPWPNPINRNYLLENAPAWSWSVTSVLKFAENFIIGGRPSILDTDPDLWILNTSGVIGFGPFTVIGELPLQPRYFLTDGTKRAWGQFGFYRDDFYPWIFFFEHGWMRIYGLDPFNIWLWTSDMGFLWTSETVYPLMYRQNDESWIQYNPGGLSGTPKETDRAFYNFRTQEWEFHPPVR